MTPEQINLVQQSFAKVAPISEQAAVLFYDRLFELDPALKNRISHRARAFERFVAACLA